MSSPITAAAGEVRSSGEPETSPVPGMDISTFRNYVTRALNGDAGVPAVILSFVNAAQRGGSNSPEARERDRWQEFFWQQAIQDNLRRLQELIETKCAERDQLLADIRDDEGRLALFEGHRQGRERAEIYRALHGAYDLNEAGELADADAEDMLRAWEQRTGKRLDRGNTVDVQDAFRQQQEFEDAQALRLQEELELERRRAGELEREIEELESARQKAETALENGADLMTVNEDLQREFIAKGHGTDEQKQRLAEEQGISLLGAQLADAIGDDFDAPSIRPAFNQAARPVQPDAPELVSGNAVQTHAPVKQPTLNLNG
jgi:hypothetical protein